MRSLFAAALLAYASGAAAQETAFKSFPAAGITALRIDVDAGDVSVKAGGAGIEVKVTGFDPRRCLLTMAPNGALLVLKAETKARTGFFRKGCEAGFQVSVPAGLRVDADTGAGSISLDSLSGEVTARTGAGEIRGTLSSSKADLHTGAGSIDLSWKAGPAKGSIKAGSGAGSVRLSFPEGTKLEADLSTGVGSISNEFGDTKGAGLRVKAASGVGSVDLVKS